MRNGNTPRESSLRRSPSVDVAAGHHNHNHPLQQHDLRRRESGGIHRGGSSRGAPSLRSASPNGGGGVRVDERHVVDEKKINDAHPTTTPPWVRDARAGMGLEVQQRGHVAQTLSRVLLAAIAVVALAYAAFRADEFQAWARLSVREDPHMVVSYTAGEVMRPGDVATLNDAGHVVPGMRVDVVRTSAALAPLPTADPTPDVVTASDGSSAVVGFRVTSVASGSGSVAVLQRYATSSGSTTGTAATTTVPTSLRPAVIAAAVATSVFEGALTWAVDDAAAGGAYHLSLTVSNSSGSWRSSVLHTEAATAAVARQSTSQATFVTVAPAQTGAAVARVVVGFPCAQTCCIAAAEVVVATGVVRKGASLPVSSAASASDGTVVCPATALVFQAQLVALVTGASVVIYSLDAATLALSRTQQLPLSFDPAAAALSSSVVRLVAIPETIPVLAGFVAVVGVGATVTATPFRLVASERRFVRSAPTVAGVAQGQSLPYPTWALRVTGAVYRPATQDVLALAIDGAGEPYAVLFDASVAGRRSDFVAVADLRGYEIRAPKAFVLRSGIAAIAVPDGENADAVSTPVAVSLSWLGGLRIAGIAASAALVGETCEVTVQGTTGAVFASLIPGERYALAPSGGVLLADSVPFPARSLGKAISTSRLYVETP